MDKSKIGTKSIALLILTIVVLVISTLLWPVGTRLNLEVNYVDAPYMQSELFLSKDGTTFDIEHSRLVDVSDSKAVFSLGRKWKDNVIYRIDLSNAADAYSVSNITFSLNENEELCLGADAIQEHFTIMNGQWENVDGNLLITPSNTDSFIFSTDNYILSSLTSMESDIIKNTHVSRIATVILLSLLAFLIICNFGKILRFLENPSTQYIPIVTILLALAGVWTIAFKSEYGIHPDEYDVIECLKYGMKHFFPPDMRADDVASTYSGYGYTKLINGTWYWYIAGKIAYVVKALWSNSIWYRVPNVLMFIAMAFIYIKNVSKKKWLILALGISVQAWYIFSYTTADAMDFFLGFLIVLILTDSDSILYKAVSEKFTLRALPRYILLGTLFGFTFLGKEIYWEVLLLAFIVLLFKLFDTKKEDRKSLLTNYVVIIACFALVVLTRYGFDFAHYGLDKSEVKNEMAVIYTDYDKNPTTPIEDRCPTYHMYEQGYSLPELFQESTNWVSMTCRSFCGIISDNKTTGAYYKIMGALYAILLMILMYFNLNKNASKMRKIEFICCFGILILSVAASVLNSYVSDSQAQGRYLLPMLFVVSYMGYRTPEFFEKKYGRVVVSALQILSVWYFLTNATGIFNV